MIALIVLGILSIVAIAATVIAVARDGYGPVRTDWSRLPDRDDPVAPAIPAAPAAPAAPATLVAPTSVGGTLVAPATPAAHAGPIAPATPVQGTRVAAPTPETPHPASLEHVGSHAPA
ncbi:hypothetical protein QE374_001652 [Microbacterium sp. SORGH_AS428]|uniref:hypothetical protein n=1 Tax=Microbacterium sp. SORGH_AS_0428 TaxID=3041788 RepID=UPI002855EDF5|nr:hypothetical protein [Microbacterium sp. SORGH_AS_0428]MDR6199743.1 hypothetical protein [Microbacterium sp. SORGH_AS_0428]